MCKHTNKHAYPHNPMASSHRFTHLGMLEYTVINNTTLCICVCAHCDSVHLIMFFLLYIFCFNIFFARAFAAKSFFSLSFSRSVLLLLSFFFCRSVSDGAIWQWAQGEEANADLMRRRAGGIERCIATVMWGDGPVSPWGIRLLSCGMDAGAALARLHLPSCPPHPPPPTHPCNPRLHLPPYTFPPLT